MNPENNNPGSLIEKAAGRLTNIVLLGFFGFICSIPVITLCTSLTATYVSMNDYLNYGNQKPLKLFFKTFKEKFKLSFITWLINLSLLIVFIWDFLYYRTSSTTINILAQALMFVLITILIFETIFSIIVIGEELENNVFKVMKSAIIISYTSFFKSLSVVILMIAPIICVIVMAPEGLVILPGIQMYLICHIIPDLLKKSKFKRGNAIYQISQRKK